MDIHQDKRIKRMERIDAMSPDHRQLVYDFGLTIVDAFTQCGVTKPKHIRHLITTVQNGSVEIGNRTENKNLMGNLLR